jgi:hypothetical protein
MKDVRFAGRYSAKILPQTSSEAGVFALQLSNKNIALLY